MKNGGIGDLSIRYYKVKFQYENELRMSRSKNYHYSKERGKKTRYREIG